MYHMVQGARIAASMCCACGRLGQLTAGLVLGVLCACAQPQSAASQQLHPVLEVTGRNSLWVCKQQCHHGHPEEFSWLAVSRANMLAPRHGRILGALLNVSLCIHSGTQFACVAMACHQGTRQSCCHPSLSFSRTNCCKRRKTSSLTACRVHACRNMKALAQNCGSARQILCCECVDCALVWRLHCNVYTSCMSGNRNIYCGKGAAAPLLVAAACLLSV